MTGLRRLERFALTGVDGGRVFTEIQGRGFDAHAALSPLAVQDLISSIGAVGLLSPVLLERLGEDSYRLVSGERRLRAMRWGSVNHPENPHFQVLAAMVDGPLGEQQRRQYQIIENMAREDLRPGDLAAALLFERCAVLESRLLLQGCSTTAVVEEDPVKRWEALDRLRVDAGLHGVGAPWEDVIGLIGISLSEHRAKSLVSAFRSMPAEVSAQMDAAGVSLASRQKWLALGKKGRDGAAEEIWAALAELERPELLTRACMEALEHPGADVDDIVELAAVVHDRVGQGDPVPLGADADEGPEFLLGDSVGSATVFDPADALEALAVLAAKLRGGHRLHPYDAGSLRLRTRELVELLEGDIEAITETVAGLEASGGSEPSSDGDGDGVLVGVGVG